MFYEQSESNSWPFCYIGAGILIVAAGLGAAIFVPELQQAMSMKAEPDSMTLQEFLDHGPGENAHVRLTELRGDADSAFRILTIKRRRFTSRSRISDQYTNLIPAKVDPADHAAQIALYAPPGSECEKNVENGFVVGRLKPVKFGTSQDGNGLSTNQFLDPSIRWLIVPVEKIPDLAMARKNFIIALLAGALGLVMANLGTANMATGVALVSLLGSPLRNASASILCRLAYFAVGAFACCYGYNVWLNHGLVGKVQHLELLQIGGFFMMQLGLGTAIAPIVIPLAYRIFGEGEQALVPSSLASNSAVPTSKVASVSYPTTWKTQFYHDPRIEPVQNSMASAPRLKVPIKLVSEIGLQFVGVYRIQDSSTSSSGKLNEAELYQCCNGLIIVENYISETKSQTRLYSILDDGLTVVTASEDTALPAMTKLGSTCSLVVLKTDEFISLFETHLERVCETAKRRSTSTIIVDSDEVLPVMLYGRRAIAGVLYQYGLSENEAAPRQYGRFDYPNGPTAVNFSSPSKTKTVASSVK